jgi:malonyl-CoA decarboxylase
LTFKPIDWTAGLAPGKAHPLRAGAQIASLEALRRRLGPDRRCFAFFHPTLPTSPDLRPVALVKGMATRSSRSSTRRARPCRWARRIPPFLFDQQLPGGPQGRQPRQLPHQDGGGGLGGGAPHLKTFATLSPIPGFMAWLGRAAEAGHPMSDPTRPRPSPAAATPTGTATPHGRGAPARSHLPLRPLPRAREEGEPAARPLARFPSTTAPGSTG